MIDVIIPCYNAEETLQRAVQSVLQQAELGILWLVDDSSIDGTLALAKQLEYQLPNKIRVLRMPENGGAAKARNWGALQSQAEFVAFLDADDAYEPQALAVAAGIFQFQPETALVRLGLKPVNLPERYTLHPNFAHAWQVMQMTGAGNTVFRRVFFLACAGFPQDVLFRELGGEDGALGIATTQIASVATAFEEAGVRYFCQDGMYVERLLDTILFGKPPKNVTPENIAYAENVTANICKQIRQLNACLNSDNVGIRSMKFTWN